MLFCSQYLRYLPHPSKRKNVIFVQIYLYQALLVTSSVLRLVTPSAFLQLWAYTSELSSLKSLISYLFSGKIRCHFFKHASFNSLNLCHSNQHYNGKWCYLSVNFLYSPWCVFSLFLEFCGLKSYILYKNRWLSELHGALSSYRWPKNAEVQQDCLV